ncbi:transposase family protein [Streptomyces antibioticus]|uniref:helix-turn-helix domain-containing protein n=1 Tax=Streptomyces antibioticus TaxID=1890 RepID=UPI00371A5B19
MPVIVPCRRSLRRSRCGWCDHGVRAVLDSPVHRAEPAAVRKAGDSSAARGCRRGPQGRPWALPLEDRALLVAAYRRTNLTMRRLAPLFGVSKPAADRIIDHLGPILALQPRKRFTNWHRAHRGRHRAPRGA